MITDQLDVGVTWLGHVTAAAAGTELTTTTWLNYWHWVPADDRRAPASSHSPALTVELEHTPRTHTYVQYSKLVAFKRLAN